MLQMSTRNDFVPPGSHEKEWELRPGGMLVQARPNPDENRVPIPTIRVRVKYGSVYHEMRIGSQATFGSELKKMLSGPTGLHHQDQKLFYKNKERDSKAFLDISGVKDKSKIMLQEDSISREKRYLEMRKNAKMETAAQSVSEISLEVSALESVISKGGKVVEMDVANLVDLLMNQLLKLDGIIVNGDVKLQRKMQVERVKKYVETLDMLKIKNSMHQTRPVDQLLVGHSLIDLPVEQRSVALGGPVVMTTQWEMFDSVLGGSSTSDGLARVAQPSFTWDLL
ncbi:BCL-2-associated athanogene [Striga asiatica]|uniref:BCL-2-associated athanogene n=1 Tax=Striga asiatica TaxID=4170 RepID=A0A5A7PV58_STRAF|nr:BCL-2-associated athanogene [Striga asiatica]